MSFRKHVGLLVPEKYADPPRLLEQIQSQPKPELWQRAEARALSLFHDMAQRVPAYRDFLNTHGVSPRNIKTIADFRTVPTIDKQNYLRTNSLGQVTSAELRAMAPRDLPGVAARIVGANLAVPRMLESVTEVGDAIFESGYKQRARPLERRRALI